MSPLENYLLQAYLDGALDESEESAFELLLLERPDLAELVEADCALRMGLGGQLKQSAGADQPATEAEPIEAGAERLEKPDTVVPISRGKRVGGAGWLSLAAAASVALAIGTGAGFSLRNEGPGLQSAAVAYVDQLRDASAIVKVPLPAEGAIVLMVPVPSVDPCTATVEIRQGDKLSPRAQPQPDQLSQVSLVMQRQSVNLGEAEVLVSCEGRLIGEYPLEFVAR